MSAAVLSIHTAVSVSRDLLSVFAFGGCGGLYGTLPSWRSKYCDTSAVLGYTGENLFPGAAVHTRGDVGKIRKQPIHPRVPELLELEIGVSLVTDGKEFLVDAECVGVHEQTERVRARDKVGGRADGPISGDRNDQALLGAYSVSVRRDVLQLLRRHHSRNARQLDQPHLRLVAQGAQVLLLEGLDEHGRVAAV